MTNYTSWVITADMGLGHQRATNPLKDVAYNGIIKMGHVTADSHKEQRLWKLFRISYEFLSRIKKIPLAGPILFSLLDKLQKISPYYPVMDLSAPTLQVKFLHFLINKGFGKELFKQINNTKFPIVTSFYASALAAEKYTDLPIYCIICDADINRAWVSKQPEKSRIVYLAPCMMAKRRLIQYGVSPERINITGFPLPDENIGGESITILKNDLYERIIRLDPSKQFRNIHKNEVLQYLKIDNPDIVPKMYTTITYAVGGAGAQVEIAEQILQSLSQLIKKGYIKLNLVAGVRKSVKDMFEYYLKKNNLANESGVKIIYNRNINEYFNDFSTTLRSTDLLWSKPSEISFYCGLGIPIIISPPIGPHEHSNKQWLMDIGAGIPQKNPLYCNEWITDYISDGRFAKAAWDGFLNSSHNGTYQIKDLILHEYTVKDYATLKN